MTSRLWPIMRREYLERVRSKAFIIATVLGPLLTGALMIIPALVAGKAGKPLRLAVLDASGKLAASVEAELAGRRRDDVARFIVEPSGQGPLEARERAPKDPGLADRLDCLL